MTEQDTAVHWCDYAGQPDIHRACMGVLTSDPTQKTIHWCWSTPAWAPRDQGLPDDVFLTTDDWFYTFRLELVTCEACLKHVPQPNPTRLRLRNSLSCILETVERELPVLRELLNSPQHHKDIATPLWDLGKKVLRLLESVDVCSIEIEKHITLYTTDRTKKRIELAKRPSARRKSE